MDALKPYQDAMERFIMDPANHDFLALVKAVRNGAVYGVKIRFPHALIMTLLFRTGSPREKVIAILTATARHAQNLSLFAFIYKALTITSRRTLHKETPSSPFLAGLAAGYLVFGRSPARHSAVTQQIVIYVFARAVLGAFKLAISPPRARPVGFQAGYEIVGPRGGGLLERVVGEGGAEMWRTRVRRGAWPVFASLSWGCVMWLWRWHPDVLQPSLRSSMKYLYENAEEWDGLKNFIWHNR